MLEWITTTCSNALDWMQCPTYDIVSRYWETRPSNGQEAKYGYLPTIFEAVGSMVVRASDSRPEGLVSMFDATEYPPVYTEYVLVKSVCPKILWAELRVQGTG
ncbi:hypothetical protein TNCV_507161 [Trichonephila clavipes]|nr:hypothetical protein TNCV_507161 [Trichonephila clavipes]